MSDFLSRIGISRKLGLLTALGVLALLVVMVLELVSERRTLMAEKETATRSLVETAASLASHFHARARSGELGEDEAQAAAIAAIKALRFGQDDYFWINDMRPYMVMHPFRPDMDGTDLAGFADPDGVHLFVEAVKRVEDGGSGFIHYAWPKPGADAPVPKISYVQEFAPWGWIIGSGIYIDDVQAALWASARAAVAKVLLVLAVLLCASWFLARSITRPIARAVAAADAMAQGHLDSEIRAKGNDEAARLLGSLQQMQQVLRRFTAAQGEMADAHEAGNISHRMPAGEFPGAYGTMAAGLNGLVAAHIAVKMQLIDIVGRYARGDLTRDMERLPGEKAKITEAIDAVKRSMRDSNAEVRRLVEAAVAGDFSQRGDAARFEFAYRELIEELNRLMAATDAGLAEIGGLLSAVSEGDLSRRIERRLDGRFSDVARDANRTVERLAEIVNQIRSGSDAMNASASEIAAGNDDLSRRTEQQAASLEETASSMEELTSTVRQNADNARQAKQLAIGAVDVASQGGEVVGKVVETMSAISDSSNRIADIIGVIDGIAFQTNILALNAAVEAARAGEQGRGFAVVAAEVRSLAQRSAGSAKEIKQLIGDSTDKVRHGNALVDQAGKTMGEIVTSIKRVTDIIADISAASQEQSAGIEQVNQAITQMDESTQQNAALVEEATAAARSMEQQAGQLVQTVAVFSTSAVRSPAASGPATTATPGRGRRHTVVTAAAEADEVPA
ncbi:methyl-accepting chemotaxis protein [Luteimonas sp. SDU82]|uniref:methyl-accepting chemotaxis protein n=1 Tax=Luteimonas sp. SDU82 TaxID=3422592 RepID=UPI003EBF67BE